MQSAARPKLATILACGWLLLLTGLASAASSLDEANEQTRQVIKKTMQERRIPGLQIAVVQGDRLVLSESYGLANVENQQPATCKTLFPLNSATKSITGVAMMQLVEAGLVDLDAPVSRYLDELPGAWRQIRVRQLLAHTSGLPDIVNEAEPGDRCHRGGHVEGGEGAARGGAGRRALRLQPDQLRPAGADHRQADRQALRELHRRAPVRGGRHGSGDLWRQL